MLSSDRFDMWPVYFSDNQIKWRVVYTKYNQVRYEIIFDDKDAALSYIESKKDDNV